MSWNGDVDMCALTSFNWTMTQILRRCVMS